MNWRAQILAGLLLMGVFVARAEGEPPRECSGADVREFLGTFLNLPEHDPAKISAESVAAAASALGYHLDFLLASVANPALPTMGFDSAVTAITRALESGHYTLDRYRYPWHTSEGERITACEGLPGVLLFRRVRRPGSTDEARLLALFLVTETPTSGIDKAALAAALAQVRFLQSPPLLPLLREGRAHTVPLIGPQFSGSAESLAIALRGQQGEDFAVLSGTATSASVGEALRSAAGTAPRVSYYSTVIPDDITAAQFYRYLVYGMGVPARNIAVLTESSTPYGQGLISRDRGSTSGRPLPVGQEGMGPRLVLPFPLHIAKLRSAWDKETKQSQGKPPDPNNPDSRRALSLTNERVDRSDILPTLAYKTLQQEDLALSHILVAISSERISHVGLLATDSEDKRFLAQQVRRFCPDVVLFTFESDLLLAHPDDTDNLKGSLVVSTYPLDTNNQGWTFPFQGLELPVQFTDRSQGIYNAAAVFLGRPQDLLEYAPPFLRDDALLQKALRPPVWISAVGQDAIVPLTALSDYRSDQVFDPRDQKHIADLQLGDAWLPSMDRVFTDAYAKRPNRHYNALRVGSANIAAILMGLWCLCNCLAYFYFRFLHRGPPDHRYPLRLFSLLCPHHEGPDSAKRSGAPFLDDRERRWHARYVLGSFLSQLGLYGYLALLYFSQFRIDRAAYYGNPTHLSWFIPGHGLGRDTVYDRELLPWGVGLYVALVVFVLLAAVVLATTALRSPPRPPPPPEPGRRRRLLLLGGSGLVVGTLLSYAGLLALLNAAWLERSMPALALTLLFERAAHLELGLSPAVPLFLLGCVVYLFCFAALRRIELLAALEPLPAPPTLEEGGGTLGLSQRLWDRGERLRSDLGTPRPNWHHALGVLAGWLVVRFFIGRLETLEGWRMTLVFHVLFTVAALAVFFALSRIISVWSCLRVLLGVLAHSPVNDAFSRLPARFAQPLDRQLLTDLPVEIGRHAAALYQRLLLNHYRHLDLKPPAPPPPADSKAADGKPAAPPPPPFDPGGFLAWRLEQVAEIESRLAEDPEWDPAGKLLGVLERFWAERPLPAFLPAGQPDPAREPGFAGLNTAAVYARALPDGVHLWLRMAEDYIAVRIASYIERIFPQLRDQMFFITSAVLLLMTAISLYPFQPHRFLMLLCGLLIVSAAGTGLVIFVQMNRDEVLSRIARTEPGKITWDRAFLMQIMLYVVVPVFGLVATQFPSISGVLGTALNSLLRVLK